MLVSFLIARQRADEKPPQSGGTDLSSQLESTVPHGGGGADANNHSDLGGIFLRHMRATRAHEHRFRLSFITGFRMEAVTWFYSYRIKESHKCRHF